MFIKEEFTMASNTTAPQYRNVSDTQLTQELFNQVICPNMRTGIRMGFLNPDSQGWTAITEIRTYLEYIGVTANSAVENLLISTGIKAPEEKKEGYINLTAFKETFLDHGSASGILNNGEGFLESRLELLLGFANESGVLTKKELGLAINNFYQCPFKEKSLLGTNVLSFEFAGFLGIFGRTDSNGDKYFSKQDIVDLWKHNRFPEGWKAPAKQFYGTWPAFANYVLMIVKRIRIGWWNIGKPT
jgi:hypothetical protein